MEPGLELPDQRKRRKIKASNRHLPQTLPSPQQAVPFYSATETERMNLVEDFHKYNCARFMRCCISVDDLPWRQQIFRQSPDRTMSNSEKRRITIRCQYRTYLFDDKIVNNSPYNSWCLSLNYDPESISIVRHLESSMHINMDIVICLQRCRRAFEKYWNIFKNINRDIESSIDYFDFLGEIVDL
jgi:hypothetical protein